MEHPAQMTLEMHGMQAGGPSRVSFGLHSWWCPFSFPLLLSNTMVSAQVPAVVMALSYLSSTEFHNISWKCCLLAKVITPHLFPLHSPKQYGRKKQYGETVQGNHSWSLHCDCVNLLKQCCFIWHSSISLNTFLQGRLQDLVQGKSSASQCPQCYIFHKKGGCWQRPL